jgi:hypothetical protein
MRDLFARLNHQGIKIDIYYFYLFTRQESEKYRIKKYVMATNEIN